MAFALEFERESAVVAGDLLPCAVLAEGGSVPEVGVSKEAVKMAVGFLERARSSGDGAVDSEWAAGLRVV